MSIVVTGYHQWYNIESRVDYYNSLLLLNGRFITSFFPQEIRIFQFLYEHSKKKCFANFFCFSFVFWFCSACVLYKRSYFVVGFFLLQIKLELVDWQAHTYTHAMKHLRIIITKKSLKTLVLFFIPFFFCSSMFSNSWCCMKSKQFVYI